MKLALIALLVSVLLPIVAAYITAVLRYRQLGRIDNNNPRDQYAQLTGMGARAVAAQHNAWESLGIYAAALLAAFVAGIDTHTLHTVAWLVIVSRVLHLLFYLGDLAPLRSGAYAVSFCSCIYLMVLAILRV